MLAAVVGTGLTTLLIAVAPVFGVFVLGTILLGATTGLHYSVATALLTRTYDDISTAISLHDAGGPFAGLVEYNARRETVEPTSEFDRIERELAVILEADSGLTTSLGV